MNQKPEVPRKDGDLDNELAKQLQFLKTSCIAFDAGDENEYVRLATTMRVLFFEGRNKSVSLLKQLNLKDKVTFLDTGIYQEKLLAAVNKLEASTGQPLTLCIQTSNAGMAVLGFGANGQPHWVAPKEVPVPFPCSDLYEGYRSKVPFAVWWESPLIETTFGLLTRCKLIQLIADKEGGAHVDEKLPPDYKEWKHFPSSPFYTENPQSSSDSFNIDDVKSVADGNVIPATIRQIAYEAITTLEQYLSTSSLKESR